MRRMGGGCSERGVLRTKKGTRPCFRRVPFGWSQCYLMGSVLHRLLRLWWRQSGRMEVDGLPLTTLFDQHGCAPTRRCPWSAVWLGKSEPRIAGINGGVAIDSDLGVTGRGNGNFQTRLERLFQVNPSPTQQIASAVKVCEIRRIKTFGWRPHHRRPTPQGRHPLLR